MKNKLSFLVNTSLKRKIMTKWFVVANVILCLVIVCLCNMDSIITAFGGDFTSKTNVYVIDETDNAYDVFNNQIEQSSYLFGEESSYNVQKYDEDLDKAKDLLNEDSNGIILVLDNKKTPLDVQMITKKYMSLMDTQLINAALNNTKIYLSIENSGMTHEEYAKISESVEIDRIFLDENSSSRDENMNAIMSTVFPILIVPIFMLTIFLVQMIGAEVNDEKSTRSMEIIISNVSPTVHFFSKVIAGNLFVLLQGLLLIVFGWIGLTIRNLLVKNTILTSNITDQIGITINDIVSSSIGDKLFYIIPLTVILLLLTFISYSLLAGILASMTTNIEDFQQLQTPIMIVLLLGYYLAMMAGMFEGATFIKVLGFVPLISAILAPSLLVLGQFGVIEVLIAIIFVIGLNYLLIKYGLKIYKVGILNYSSKDLWKKMFKAIKER